MGNNKIIPFINGKLYPHALLFPNIPYFTYGKFPFQSAFLRYLMPFRESMFGSATDIVTGHSPTRGRIVLGLRSNTEYLEFKEAVLAPTYNFMLFDSIVG